MLELIFCFLWKLIISSEVLATNPFSLFFLNDVDFQEHEKLNKWGWNKNDILGRRWAAARACEGSGTMEPQHSRAVRRQEEKRVGPGAGR